MQSSPASVTIYKICDADAWRACARSGRYLGSADDARDGYIHFSTSEQLAGTAAKFFRGQENLLLVAVDAGRLGPALKWEPSRGGALFPHLHGPLDTAHVLWTRALELGDDGVPVLPREIIAC